MRVRNGKQPVAFPLLALTAWLSMPSYAAEGEFSLGSDFLKAEPTQARGLPGTDLQSLKHMAPQTLSQLMAAAKGQLPLNRKGPLLPLVRNPNTPEVYVSVSGPSTKGQLTQVALADPMKIREKEEEEILREAEAALKMDLPDPEPRPLPMKKVKAPARTNFVEVKKPEVSIQAVSKAARLELSDIGQELQISPKTLQMTLQDDGIVVIDKNLRGSPQMFLRNPKLVRWDAARKKLDARDLGRTELYITYRDQLYIVPIEVKGGQQRDPLLADTPASFQKLTSVMPMNEQPYGSFSETFQVPADTSLVPDVPVSKPRPGLSLATSIAQVAVTADRQETLRSRFVYPDANPDYRTVDVQVIDDRSTPEVNMVYPVSGVTVRILGTRLGAGTDIQGHARFGELPEGSRFYVQVQDEQQGKIIPTVSEVALFRDRADEVLRARVMDFGRFSSYLSILDLAQDSEKASLCARVMSDDGKNPMSGYRVAINVKADGPFYIGQFGPQRDLPDTEANGRFCFFNVQPGLAELSFHQGSKFVTATALPLFAGAHTEEDLPLETYGAGRVFLAAMPSAVDQIYQEKSASEAPFQPVDFVNMVAVGQNRDLHVLGDSVLGFGAGASRFKGRIYTASEGPEFERILSAIDRDKEVRKTIAVAPLLQRGYVQDVFHELAVQDNNYASIAFDPALGAVLVMHKLESGLGAVNVTLADSIGQVFDQGWSFGNPEDGLSRTIFFNMQPGLYSVKVENLQGAILSLDTLAVDYSTVSISQTGSTAHYSLQQVRRED